MGRLHFPSKTLSLLTLDLCVRSLEMKWWCINYGAVKEGRAIFLPYCKRAKLLCARTQTSCSLSRMMLFVKRRLCNISGRTNVPPASNFGRWMICLQLLCQKFITPKAFVLCTILSDLTPCLALFAHITCIFTRTEFVFTTCE